MERQQCRGLEKATAWGSEVPKGPWEPQLQFFLLIQSDPVFFPLPISTPLPTPGHPTPAARKVCVDWPKFVSLSPSSPSEWFVEPGAGNHYLAVTSAWINQYWNDLTLFPLKPTHNHDLFVLQRSNMVPWLSCCWLMDCWKGQYNSHNSLVLFCQIGFKKKKKAIVHVKPR